MSSKKVQLFLKLLRKHDSDVNQYQFAMDFAFHGAFLHVLEAASRCHVLHTLNLINCRDTSDDAKHLFRAIRCNQFSALAALNLSGCLGHSGAESLAITLRHANCRLHTLTLNAQIGSSGAILIARALFETPTAVRELSLLEDSIGARGTRALADVLSPSSATPLHLLSLNGNTKIGNYGAKSIFEALRHNCTLRALHMDNIGFPFGSFDDAVVTLADALHVNSALQTLSLQSNAFTAQKATLLFAAVASERCAVTELQLSHINALLGAPEPLLGFQRQWKCTKLVLNYCALDDSSAIVLARALPSCATLHTLSLCGNAIMDAGIVALSDALMRRPSRVHTLLLSSNCIADVGARALGRVLRHGGGAPLQTLALDRCFTLVNQDKFALANEIADALQHNHTLHHLSLYGVQMGSTAIASLARTLVASNCALRSLYLGVLQILSRSDMIIFCAIAKNQSLRVLQFGQFHRLASLQSLVPWRALEKALSQNGTLEKCLSRLPYAFLESCNHKFAQRRRWQRKVLQVFRLATLCVRTNASTMPINIRRDVHGAALRIFQYI